MADLVVDRILQACIQLDAAGILLHVGKPAAMLMKGDRRPVREVPPTRREDIELFLAARVPEIRIPDQPTDVGGTYVADEGHTFLLLISTQDSQVIMSMLRSDRRHE